MANYISTGSCNGKRLHPAFLELSEFTSGQALLLKDAEEVEKLKNSTGEALEGTTFISMGSTMLGRKKRSSGRRSQYRFPVDDSIETLTISVKTTLRDTNGVCFFWCKSQLFVLFLFYFLFSFFIARYRVTNNVLTLLIIRSGDTILTLLTIQ